MGPEPAVRLTGTEEVIGEMIFKTKVEVGENCEHCLVILKQSYHPNWRATVDGKDLRPFIVFPFFTAVSLTQQGAHDVVFSYQPSTLKVFLVILEFIVLTMLILLSMKNRVGYRSGSLRLQS